MTQLAIRYADCSNSAVCAVCGETVEFPCGPCLCLTDADGVCRDCGKRMAPHMLALLDLAKAADRVGRTCRYRLVPPMESLLDLARAAENYSTSKQNTVHGTC